MHDQKNKKKRVVLQTNSDSREQLLGVKKGLFFQEKGLFFGSNGVIFNHFGQLSFAFQGQFGAKWQKKKKKCLY